MTPSRAAQEKPTSPLTAEDEAAIKERHRPVLIPGSEWVGVGHKAGQRGRHPDRHECSACETDWPCDAARLLLTLAAIEREAAAATPSLDGLAMAKWIRQHYVGSVDHACSECVPDGSMVVPGFVCAPHIAARLDEGSATPEQKEK